MHRRQYLTAASGALLAGAAGCSGPADDGTGDENGTGSPTDGGGELSAMAEARAHIEVAAGAVAADASIETFAGVESGYAYDEAAFTEAVDGAEAALDRAESAGDASRQTIRVLRAYVAVIRARATANASIVTIAGHVTTATDHFAAGEYDASSAELETAGEGVMTARGNLAAAREAWETLVDRAPPDTEVPVNEIRAGIDTAAAVVTVLEEHAAGGVHLNAGLQDRAQGHARYDEPDYRRARNSFLEARQDLTEARDRYRDGQAAVDIALRAELAARACWTEVYLEAVGHMETACAEALDEDYGPAGDAEKRARDTIRSSTCGPIE